MVEAVSDVPLAERNTHRGNVDVAASTLTPIVVDLDGTLVSTDTLIESVIALVKRSPLHLIRVLFWLLKGRAAFKANVAAHVTITVDSLPFHMPLLAYLRDEKAAGRRIVLATAAHESVAHLVSRHLNLFDDVLASNAARNLKGQAKLRAICEKVGQPFIYAGDSAADIPIWKAAEQAIFVNVRPAVAGALQGHVAVARAFQQARPGLAVWVRALRLHQWAKNTLLLVPLLTSFGFVEIGKVVTTSIAFLAFSIAASATYILNDLWDLSSDRAHPRKRLRPFASGTISLAHGFMVAAGLLTAATLLAFTLSQAFFVMLLGYLVLTTAYSLVFKRYVLMDVIMLALLYAYRILVGSVAIEVRTSAWLIAFSAFFFLSLALVKRCSELLTLVRSGQDKARGRDYRADDLVVLWPFGIGAALSATVVLGLFISAPETQARYETPELLWLVAVSLVYWLGRLWVKTSRDEMHDDPIIFAVQDRASWVVFGAMTLLTLAARFLRLDTLS